MLLAMRPLTPVMRTLEPGGTSTFCMVVMVVVCVVCGGVVGCGRS